MSKTRRRVATAATIAGLGGLGVVALASNPGHQVANGGTVVTNSAGRPIVTSSSGAASGQVLAQNVSTRSPGTHGPVVTRASGAAAGTATQDD